MASRNLDGFRLYLSQTTSKMYCCLISALDGWGMTQEIRRMLMLNQAATYKAVALTAAEIAAVILIVLAMSTATSSTASANAAIAKSTGQPCTKCHTAPPALNNYGKKYKESKKKE
jgi:hypothetical protein